MDRANIRRGLYLGDSEWEELFDALRMSTLPLAPPDSPIPPRHEAVHNDQVRTVVVPDAGHCARRDQPVRYLRAVDAFLAQVACAEQTWDEEAPDEEGRPWRWSRLLESDAGGGLMRTLSKLDSPPESRSVTATS